MLILVDKAVEEEQRGSVRREKIRVPTVLGWWFVPHSISVAECPELPEQGRRQRLLREVIGNGGCVVGGTLLRW